MCLMFQGDSCLIILSAPVNGIPRLSVCGYLGAANSESKNYYTRVVLLVNRCGIIPKTIFDIYKDAAAVEAHTIHIKYFVAQQDQL